jgi:hypothetical protein
VREQRARVSKNSDTGKAIDYSLKRRAALTRFLDDGRLCMSNNTSERELGAVALGRRNWTFAGSDEGGRRAAALYTLVATAKLNEVDPQAWLADVLARLLDHPAKRIGDLIPGTGTQNAVPPPDTLLLRSQDGAALSGCPATRLSIWTARWVACRTIGDQYFMKMDKSSNSTTADLLSVFSTVISPAT